MKRQGFVLITVILMLTVMTLLVVANMRWVNLYWRRHMDLQRFQEHMMQFEQMADKMAARFDNHPQASCFINTQNTEQLKQTIWKNGCRLSPFYRYAVTDLGVYPCVKFSSIISTHHWLLSVMDERLPHRMLQCHIATPILGQSCPKTQVVMIQNSFITRRLV